MLGEGGNLDKKSNNLVEFFANCCEQIKYFIYKTIKLFKVFVQINNFCLAMVARFEQMSQ